MATQESHQSRMRAVMQAYIDGFNARDSAALAALFADNARIEDPVGGPIVIEGKATIEEFYSGAVQVVERLELAAPIRASHSNFAAMAFDIHMSIDDTAMHIRVIDVMEFDDDGKIVDMRAYHGPGDVTVGS